MSIVFHHYKTLKEKNLFYKDHSPVVADLKKDISIENIDNKNIILKREIEKWNNYYSVLRKPNRILFDEMLQMSYKYSDAINGKGEQFSTESLLLTLVFEQDKLINKNRNKLTKNLN